MGNKIKIPAIYFSPEELAVISMGLAKSYSDLKGIEAQMPLPEDIKKRHKEILTAINTSAAKMKRFAGVETKLEEPAELSKPWHEETKPANAIVNYKSPEDDQ